MTKLITHRYEVEYLGSMWKYSKSKGRELTKWLLFKIGGKKVSILYSLEKDKMVKLEVIEGRAISIDEYNILNNSLSDVCRFLSEIC